MIKPVETSSVPTLNPVAHDFILYCVDNHGTQWPTLYDKMCWVASRHLFRGMGYEGLRAVGISLSLDSIEDTYKKVDAVITERQNLKHD